MTRVGEAERMSRVMRVAGRGVVVGWAFIVAAGGVAPAASGAVPGSAAGPRLAGAGRGRPAAPAVRSNVALVLDAARGETLYAKHPEQVAPIASITKLMTAIVVLDAGLPLDEAIEIQRDDRDTLKHSRSRLPLGARLERGEVLRVALMASDNRAAAALARTYPGGTAACVEAMNLKARALGMPSTRFTDPAGLSGEDVSSAEDLARLVLAAGGYPLIREATTSTIHPVTLADGRVLQFHNSNRLVSNRTWTIGLSKTGYIREAGRCLVMQAEIAARQVVIVLLDSWGKYTRLGDASRIRKWMEETLPPAVPADLGAPAIAPAGAGAGRPPF